MDIIKICRDKAGIYKWTNNINGKFYIGSSLKLSVSFLNYFHLSYLTFYQNKSLIYKSLLKYGHSNFTLEILEFCKNNKIYILEREQYYLDNLKPEYNLLKVAGYSPLFIFL